MKPCRSCECHIPDLARHCPHCRTSHRRGEWFPQAVWSVVATVNGERVLVGSQRLMQEHEVDVAALLPQAEALEGAAKTVMYVATAADGHQSDGWLLVV